MGQVQDRGRVHRQAAGMGAPEQDVGDSFLCRYTSYTAKSTKPKVATDLLRILVYIIICVRFTQKEGAVGTCTLGNV